MIKHEEARPGTESPPLFVVTPRVIAARKKGDGWHSCADCALGPHECQGGDSHERVVNCYGVNYKKFPLPSDELKLLHQKAILTNKNYMVME